MTAGTNCVVRTEYIKIFGVFMALPKTRQSKARGRKRRTHYKASHRQTATCAQCGQPKMSHRACPNCGYYRGRPVVSVTE